MATHMHMRHELDITKVQKDYSVLLRNSFTLQRDVFYVTGFLYFLFHNLISHTHFLIKFDLYALFDNLIDSKNWILDIPKLY